MSILSAHVLSVCPTPVYQYCDETIKSRIMRFLLKNCSRSLESFLTECCNCNFIAMFCYCHDTLSVICRLSVCLSAVTRVYCGLSNCSIKLYYYYSDND